MAHTFVSLIGKMESTALKRSHKRILVIDDDPGILDFIEELLSFRFQILKAADASTGLQLADAGKPDLIILDLDLEKQSGHDLCRVLRARPETKHIPILIYTGSDDIDNVTKAFDFGADDYVIKSARPRELVARVVAKIRRLEEQVDEPDIMTCGNLTLNAARLEATVEDKTIPLSVLEFNLLRFFVINKDRVVSRQQILEGVWKDAIVSNRTIDTHMVYLRKKLVGFSHSLATVYGAGYILREARP
jgi:DNA-binding response OmpR family regulator